MINEIITAGIWGAKLSESRVGRPNVNQGVEVELPVDRRHLDMRKFEST
jgi:hypothetical protein